MKLLNNVSERLADDLKTEIRKGSKLAIAASSFSIYAFEALKKEFKSVEELRFIFTSPTFVEEKFQKISREFYIPHIYNEKQLCGGEFELRLKNELNQRAIARECSNWVKAKAVFKSNRQFSQPLHSMVHIDSGESDGIAYSNISGFTTADLGLTARNGFPTLISKVNYPESNEFLKWFNQVWENEADLKDVTGAVQEYFENAYKENSPEFIYFLTLYNIFNSFLSDLSLDSLPNEEIGFKNTIVWSKLYNFQRDAVIGAINKLDKYNGCIIADSVGLGKTFSALGVIKYYNMRNKDVLVLCPKKLEANWNTFNHNDKNNFLAKDRLRYDVLFHTDLSRETGISNSRHLENVAWGNYGLIVIDESHNFRNNNVIVGKESRYQKLLRKVIKEGIETKVLMLSATPVNNRFNDLKNQLALAYEGNPELIDERLNTGQGIEQIFRRAQQSFNAWSKFTPEKRTTESLLEMLDFDFFEILDSLTIARSRKHITTYYDTQDIGKFPMRNRPRSIEPSLTNDNRINFQQIADRLSQLNLSVYSPLNYIKQSKIAAYAEKYDKKVRSGTFTQKDREKSLQLLMRINLLKRIESSVNSFALTLENINIQVENALAAIAREDEKIGAPELDTFDEDIDWEDDWGEEENMIGKSVKVRVADIDTTRWKEDLEADLAIINDLIVAVATIRDSEDLKLQKLEELIEQKIKEPLNPGNRKILIFTAFADTANYLYKALKDEVSTRFGINTALITGSKRLCNVKDLSTDLNVLLTCFSPISKGKAQILPEVTESIDLVIATDCISEGQNLQDCDFLINYDIHWNPVRIIQRFGRIDRIGSINSNITMVNFWPDVSLDAYINLKQRVESRMLISNLAGTGDDNILNTEDQELEYRKIQLKRLKDEVVDLEDLREGVSITDLGLNDFRVDLANYIKTFGELKNIPTGLHAIADASESAPPGVIFVLENINAEINIDKQNRLHPFYLVYLKANGELIHGHFDAKKTLDIFRLLAKGKNQPLDELCKVFSKETDEYRDMSNYSNLLKKAIGSILKTDEEKDVMSLFKSGGTTALREKIKGIEDFKLISFLIIK